MTLKEVMYNRSLHVVSKAIYCYLYCSIVEENKKIIPRTDICESLKISPSTFSRHIKELVKKTTVKVTQTYMDGRFYHNTYTIEGVGNIDEHPPEQPQKCSEEPKMDNLKKNLAGAAHKILGNLGKYTSEQQGKILEILKYLESN